MLRSRPLAAALVALSVVAACFAPAPGTTAWADDDPNALKAQYDEVLGKEAALQAKVDAAAARRVDLIRQIAEVNHKLTATDLRLISAQRALERAIAVDRRAQADLVAARRRLRRATDALHAQAVSSYMRGSAGADAMQAVMTDPDDVTIASRTMSYAHAVVDHQRDVVAEFHAAKAATDTLAARSAGARRAATKARDAIALSKRQLLGHRLELAGLDRQAHAEAVVEQAALTQLRGHKLEIEARITSEEKESDGIALTLAGLQRGQPDYTPGSVVFAPPLDTIRISSPFGYRFHPILHYQRLHTGDDLGAAMGTPIHAAADGTVVIAGVRGGYGNATVIDHGHSIATLYGHQSRIDVRPGQRVEKGDVIGLVGSTGMSTGPHLHFETRLRGTPVNPLSVFDLGAAPAATPPGD